MYIAIASDTVEPLWNVATKVISTVKTGVLLLGRKDTPMFHRQ